MQTQIKEAGIVEIQYRCSLCPLGCGLTDRVAGNRKEIEKQGAVIHQHPCHRFPSVTTNWVRIP